MLSHILLTTSLFLVTTSKAAEQPASFVLVGDSTTAHKQVRGGWGDGFCGSEELGTSSVLEPDIPCFNLAHSGATTGSFVANGYWEESITTIKAEIEKGRKPYVTIQFGHNDQKIAPPESMGQNLTAMVQELQALEAEPVLVTSLTRRNFNSNGTINDILGPWADETKLIAKQQGTHLLDLLATSIKYCEAIGPDASHRLNLGSTDKTHLNVPGSIVFGRMVADLLNASFPGVLPIVPDPELSNNITLGIPSY
ncbi:carbohydrate esterase family 12 protein [Moniliophthora roreri]|uniref:Putative SGNH hydrolase n=1 Tax=Moniliophthora roreri TaxID=221103 RepID=A0A0W0F4M7_MONRR|nr:carbohydrate esterase family 12 protein [Moniliophthora roreri]